MKIEPLWKCCLLSPITITIIITIIITITITIIIIIIIIIIINQIPYCKYYYNQPIYSHKPDQSKLMVM